MQYAKQLALALATIALLSACGSKKQGVTLPPPTPPSEVKPIQPTKPISWVPPLGDSIKHEMRAVWITTAYGLDWPKVKADTPNGERRQKEELERILDRLVDDGYNTVFFQARLSGSVNYYSKEPFSRVFTSSGERPNYDPLTFAVEACRRRGLSVHAWIVTYPLSSLKGVPHPIARQNPSWVVMHRGGRHLDPGVPAVRSYIAQLTADIVRRYDVDGIHFDYFRYPEEAERFNDSNSYTRYGEGMDKSAWRRNNLTQQLVEIQDSIRNLKPEVQLSVAPLGKLRKIEDLGRAHGWTAYESVHQDVETWAQRKLVDFIVPMMYYKDELYEPFLIDWQRTVGKYIPVVAGLAPYRVNSREEKYPWSPSVIQEQIQIARRHKASGVSMFREGNIGPSQPLLRTLIQREFKQTALVPPLDRGLATKPPQPHALHITIQEGRKLKLSWQMPQEPTAGTSYRVWATTTHENGQKESILLVQGLSTTECTLRLLDFRLQDCLELGVEAVNRLGVSTPCDKAVEFNLVQDRITSEQHKQATK